ncbi:MAG: single-stranded DNA-binding protein [Microcoleaceae cyanobacterium]
MNNCIVMAEIVQDPQLRYTAESQIPIAEMMVQFPSIRQDDPPSIMKVIGWGNLAQELSQRYHQGDRVIIEGRLGMMMIDRPEGFKEKRAELTARRVYSASGVEEVSDSSAPSSSSSAAPSNVVPLESRNRPATSPTPEVSSSPEPSTPSPAAQPLIPTESDDPDYDPIPF